MSDEMRRDWQKDMSYDEMHHKYAPWGRCECSHCDMQRLFEEWEDWAWNQGARARGYPYQGIDTYHQHECEECHDLWDCENDLCESLVTVMDRCDNCEDGR